MGSIDPVTKAIVMPLQMATTFVRDPDNQYRAGYLYGRPDNATVRETEAVIAMLEGAAGALLFGSGMAAISAVFQSLEPGDHIVAQTVMYAGSRNWLRDEGERRGLTYARVDTTDLAAGSRRRQRPARPSSSIETPATRCGTSPTSPTAAKIAHAAGARLRGEFHPWRRRCLRSAEAWRRHRRAFGRRFSTAIPT